MKRLYFSVVLLLAAIPLFAGRVDSETAKQVAMTFLNNNGAKAAQLIDLSKEAGFPNLYIFNNAPGFVVMSADDCVQPVLGYSLTGSFVVKNMPTNVSGWLQGYNDEIQYAIDNQIKASDETAMLWKELANGNSKAGRATVVVDALIQSTWDQDPGYNDLCPYDSNAGELTVTGCVATAMAQIMRYWEYPSSGTSEHSYTPSNHPEYGTQSVNYANATYNWTAMPLHSSSAEIAKLMYHCGVSVDMMYGVSSEGGSGAYSNDIPNALTTYFRYKSGVSFEYKGYYSENNWLNLIKTELNAGRPVEYNGSGSGGGHAFVCDGYDNSNYFHFNWGWSGANDGFYSLSNLVPGSGGSGGGSYSFTSNQTAVIGIQPKDCTTSTPISFNVTKEGRNALLTWSAASNAASYSIYRNGVLYANTTGTSYTDSNLAYGTYAYYVKSRDTNGAASSPTATITVAVEPVPADLTLTRNGNGGTLNWTTPSWGAPFVDNQVLTYGDGSFLSRFGAGEGNTTNYYFGHRYPKEMLSNNKVLYKVSFYAAMTGAYKLYVYTASAGNSKPQTQVYTQNITVSVTGWNDIILNNRYQIDASKDLWVFICDTEAKSFPMGIGSFSENDYGSYIAVTPTSAVYAQSGYVMLIRSCITEGTYYYDLYDGNTSIASNLTGTSYTLSNIANNTAHLYTLKTSYNNSVATSNLAGITLGTATISSLALENNDKMIVTEGSHLTVSEALSNSTAANLVLENEAQLTHHSDNVQATYNKNISAYTDNGGWYTIATPFVSYDPTNVLATTNYDLYAYDEDGDSEGKEWINYKSGSFNLTQGQGYLYAHNPSVALSLNGTLSNGDYTSTINLSYANTENNIKGYNLLGNPTAHEITFSKTNNVSDGYYYLNNGDSWTYETSNTVPPGRGFLVKANATGQTVTLNPQSKRGDDEKTGSDMALLQIDVDGESAYVKTTEGVSMPLLSFKDKMPSVFLTQDGKRYIMLVNDNAETIDLCYQPHRAGQHQLTVTLKNTDVDYLHLIDNLTGADIDLLSTPSYSFESTITDYASRFKLLFSENKDNFNNNDNFAFFNGNDWTVNYEGDAILQIVDMTGRIIIDRRDGVHTVSTDGMAPGIYVLRLITENDIKTQKIIIN